MDRGSSAGGGVAMERESAERTRDAVYLRRALKLAQRGLQYVSPNPLVGAVIVRSGKIVAEGYHRRCGGAHAEVEAIRRAGVAARGADLYVTLEPCGHHGRTPPCSEAIVRAGIRRVVYAASDPNPLTRGAGLRLLRRSGVDVRRGPCGAEVRSQNAPYFHWREHGRPWILLKWAMTLDGKAATSGGESKWITGARAREHAQTLRRRVDAICVGTETARLDDPLLSARPPRGRFPRRVVLDRRASLPLTLRLLSDPRGGGEAGETIYVTSRRAPAARLRRLEAAGARILRCPLERGRFDLRELLTQLSELEVSQLLVEGGGATAGSFLEAGLVDEVAVYIAPRLLGGVAARPAIGGGGLASLGETPWLRAAVCRRLGDDFLISGRLGR